MVVLTKKNKSKRIEQDDVEDQEQEVQPPAVDSLLQGEREEGGRAGARRIRGVEGEKGELAERQDPKALSSARRRPAGDWRRLAE